MSIFGTFAIIGARFDSDYRIKSGFVEIIQILLYIIFCLPLGSAYFFITKNSGSTWSQTYKVISPDSASNDNFGWSVSLYKNTAVIGSPYDDDKGMNSGIVNAYIYYSQLNSTHKIIIGSAYFYTTSNNGVTWSHTYKVVAVDGAPRQSFGYSVNINANIAKISSRADYGKSNSGTQNEHTRM